MICNCKFKSVTNDDIKKARRINWNITIGTNHKPLSIYSIEDCIHTKGGKYGINSYYTAKRDIDKDELTVDDLRPFNGSICWGYSVTQHNYYKKDEVRVATCCKITCGGEQVYEFGYSWDLMPHKIMCIIDQLRNLPINIAEIDYSNRYVLGRKILYKDIPVIIKSYNKSGGEIIISADMEDIKDVEQVRMVYKLGAIDILSPHIDWFR